MLLFLLILELEYIWRVSMNGQISGYFLLAVPESETSFAWNFAYACVGVRVNICMREWIIHEFRQMNEH